MIKYPLIVGSGSRHNSNATEQNFGSSPILPAQYLWMEKHETFSGRMGSPGPSLVLARRDCLITRLSQLSMALPELISFLVGQLLVDPFWSSKH